MESGRNHYSRYSVGCKKLRIALKEGSECILLPNCLLTIDVGDLELVGGIDDSFGPAKLLHVRGISIADFGVIKQSRLNSLPLRFRGVHDRKVVTCEEFLVRWQHAIPGWIAEHNIKAATPRWVISREK